MTPAANFSTSFATVVDTNGKFAAGVNDTGGKFATGVNDKLEKNVIFMLTLLPKGVQKKS
jgi:hypothetical protein